jgi:hypothetical protein
MPRDIPIGIRVLSRDGKQVGQTTGSSHKCQLKECWGWRIGVRWGDGSITYPCSAGMDSKVINRKKVWRICPTP